MARTGVRRVARRPRMGAPVQRWPAGIYYRTRGTGRGDARNAGGGDGAATLERESRGEPAANQRRISEESAGTAADQRGNVTVPWTVTPGGTWTGAGST